MRYLDEQRLYDSTEACLASLRSLEANPSVLTPARPEPVHFYWRGELSRKQAFALQSLVATQDLEWVEPWLWLDAEDGWAGHERNPYLRALGPSLRVLRWEPEVAVRDTPLEGHALLDDRSLDDRLPARRSDLFRHVVLWRHGGVYADVDLMFLRDLRPLLTRPGAGEFCSSWSADRPFANSAVLRLRQGGETAWKLLERCAALGSCDPRAVLRLDECQDLDLLVLPCGFFDPLWPHRDQRERLRRPPFDRFGDFFRAFGLSFRRKRWIRSSRDFFPGAFAYHWHNCWDAEEVERSYFGRFAAELARNPSSG
jgi:hypothetical protein